MAAAEFSMLGIITLVAGSSVLAAVVTQGATWFRDSLGRSHEQAYAKLCVVAALEEYANSASNALSESETFYSSRGTVGADVRNVPEFPGYGERIDWKALGIELTKRAWSFPVEVEAARTMIKFEWEAINDEDIVLPTVREKIARAGSRALQIASAMSARSDEAPIGLVDELWDTRSLLRAKLQEYTEERERAEAEAARLHAEMVAAGKDPFAESA